MDKVGGVRMEDRFRYRVWDKTQNKWLHFDFSTYPTYQDRIWQALTDGETFYQCTGLKDKNGKLIYEGDIVKYAEFDWTDFSFKDWETEIAQVVWGNTYDNYYPAFDLKDTDFDGTNAFAYLFNEGWTIEVIGNVYQNPELLED